MKRSSKSRKINSKSLKKLKNKKLKISKKKRTISFSLNKRDISLESKSQEKILLIIKKYLINENQNELKKIL